MFDKNQIKYLEKLIGCKMPETIEKEMLDSNSILNCKRELYKFTFMTLEEHEEILKIKNSAYFPIFNFPEAKVLWKDIEDHYIALFIDGPLFGKISFIDDNSVMDYSPIFRSFDSFISSLKSGLKYQRSDFPYCVDYPNFGDEMVSSPSLVDSNNDLNCVNYILEQLGRETHPIRKRFFTSCVISMTPFSHRNIIVNYIDNEDWFLSGKACGVLGFYRDDTICEKLISMIEQMEPCIKFRAVDALGFINTDKSREALLKLLNSKKSMPANISSALKANEFKINSKLDFANAKCVIECFDRRICGESYCEIEIDPDLRKYRWW